MKWVIQNMIVKFCRPRQPAIIKFTHEDSKLRIFFHNACTILSEGTLITLVYSKHTETHQYLSPQSCQLKHCIKCIPFRQARHIKSIRLTAWKTQQRLGQLKMFKDKVETSIMF